MRPQRPPPQAAPPHPPAQPPGQRPPAQAARQPRRPPQRRAPAAAHRHCRCRRRRPAPPPRRTLARRPGPRPRAAAPQPPQHLRRRRRAAAPPRPLPGSRALHPWPAHAASQPRRPQRERPPERRPLSHPARWGRRGGPAAALSALPGRTCRPGQALAGRRAAGAPQALARAAAGACLKRRPRGYGLRRMHARSGAHRAQPSAETPCCWPVSCAIAGHLAVVPDSGLLSRSDARQQHMSAPAHACRHAQRTSCSLILQRAWPRAWDITAGASRAGHLRVGRAAARPACRDGTRACAGWGGARRACPTELAAAGDSAGAAHGCSQAPLCACLRRRTATGAAVSNQSGSILTLKVSNAW